MKNPESTAEQEALCKRLGVPCVPPRPDQKVGIARNVREGLQPINGLRHPPAGDTSGWYLWAGEGDPPSDPDFFLPLHVSHLASWCPSAIPYLGLPPGWRFLVADGQEDVWSDQALLTAGR